MTDALTAAVYHIYHDNAAQLTRLLEDGLNPNSVFYLSWKHDMTFQGTESASQLRIRMCQKLRLGFYSSQDAQGHVWMDGRELGSPPKDTDRAVICTSLLNMALRMLGHIRSSNHEYNLDVVKTLLQHGAEPSYETYSTWFPLYRGNRMQFMYDGLYNSTVWDGLPSMSHPYWRSYGPRLLPLMFQYFAPFLTEMHKCKISDLKFDGAVPYMLFLPIVPEAFCHGDAKNHNHHYIKWCPFDVPFIPPHVLVDSMVLGDDDSTKERVKDPCNTYTGFVISRITKMRNTLVFFARVSSVKPRLAEFVRKTMHLVLLYVTSIDANANMHVLLPLELLYMVLDMFYALSLVASLRQPRCQFCKPRNRYDGTVPLAVSDFVCDGPQSECDNDANNKRRCQQDYAFLNQCRMCFQ